MEKKYFIVANSVTGKGRTFKKNETVPESRLVEGTVADLLSMGAITLVVDPPVKEKTSKNEQK